MDGFAQFRPNVTSTFASIRAARPFPDLDGLAIGPTALMASWEQGLKLEPARDPVEFLVIDRVGRNFESDLGRRLLWFELSLPRCFTAI